MNRALSTESVSQRVVEEVADVTDTDPCNLEPLFHTVDPDGLNMLFRNADSDVVREEGFVEFPYAGCRVVVWADGTVRVSSGDEAEDVGRSAARNGSRREAASTTD